MSNTTKYVFGYGTGRCGTESLAHLLNRQHGVTAYHEQMPLHWLPTPGYHNAVGWLKGIDNYVVGAVGYYWMKYIPFLLKDFYPVKFIHIWREKEEVVESFWNRKQNTIQNTTPSDEWFGMYPFLGYPPTKDRIAETWDKYHYIARKLEALLTPKMFLKMHMKDLNDLGNVEDLLNFVEAPEHGRVIERVHINKGPVEDLLPGLRRLSEMNKPMKRSPEDLSAQAV